VAPEGRAADESVVPLVESVCGVLACGHDASIVHAVEWADDDGLVRAIARHCSAMDTEIRQYALDALCRALAFYDVGVPRPEGCPNRVRSCLLSGCGDFPARLRALKVCDDEELGASAGALCAALES
jgi:hypothetical protein